MSARPEYETTPLRLLILEDSVPDAALEVAVLDAAGYVCLWERVETREEFVARLQTSQYDLILADYSLPSFDGLTALRLVRGQDLDTPFILVSGLLGEETAIESLKQGATDYVVKARLERLAPVVRRALREQEEQRQRKRAEEERDRIFTLSRDLIAILTYDGWLKRVNPAWQRMLGFTEQELRAAPVTTLIHPDDLEEAAAVVRAVTAGAEPRMVENRYRCRDGSYRWIEWIGVVVPAERLMYATGRDITERKRTEQALEDEADIAAALARVGREIIGLVDRPALLDRLCRLATEVLACDVSHTFLWQPEERVFDVVAGHGDTPEQWEALRTLRVPGDMVGELVAQLQRDGLVQVNPQVNPDMLPPGLQAVYGVTTGLLVALRCGDRFIGAQSGAYRGRLEPFTAKQERIAQGMAQLAALALENAFLVEELEHANRIKSEFVATMSHELRTPLNAIMGFNDLLLDGTFGPVTPEQADQLRLIEKNSRALLDLINATLDLSRIESSRVALELTELSVDDLIAEIEAETRSVREKPGLSFSWEIASGLPRLRTDAVKLKVVLKNVIGNAVKFSDRGRVVVSARGRHGGIEFSVKDTGVGIAPALFPIIFEAFRQGDSSMTRRYGGVGLGLYVARRLLELLGGTISVESEVGRGSTFRIWVPTSPDATTSGPNGVGQHQTPLSRAEGSAKLTDLGAHSPYEDSQGRGVIRGRRGTERGEQ